MRVPLSWLFQYCDPGLDSKQLAEKLALSGTEVERRHSHGVAGGLEHFVIGHVDSVEKHPEADRLSICQVSFGNGTADQIVCGGPNVAAGQTVAVARPGAVMPDGTKLGKVKLRGAESNGMILAEDELGIGVEHNGILVLGDELKPGTPLIDVLPITTDVLELEITPNRPDCLSIYGVAREVHAVTGATLSQEPWVEDRGSAGELEGITINVEDQELCRRFTARLFENVEIKSSPLWLKARLMAAGQRPINNVVDITNYVMLLTGQPLHAFDADRVAGNELTVRHAKEGETLTTLDGTERTFDASMLVITDADGITSVGGIMGGARSEVSDTTTRVLMEAANWNGTNIQRTSSKLALRSEASSRFEKQLSPDQTMEAQIVSTSLMIELCGAKVAAGTIDIGATTYSPKKIRLRDERVTKLLGAAIPRERSAEILKQLGFTVNEAADGLDVKVPHFRRYDITREADLIEEVARIWGMDHLPSTLPARNGAAGRLSKEQKIRRRTENVLAGAGLFEVVGWSFISPELPDRLNLSGTDPRRDMVIVANPMSEEQSVMRTTLLNTVLDAAKDNRARGRTDLRFFELGVVYFKQPNNSSETSKLPIEKQNLAVLLSGDIRPRSWKDNDPKANDFFSVKAVLATVLDTLRLPWSVEKATQPLLHPGRSAEVKIANKLIGWIGELHPNICEEWEIPPAAAFEIDFDEVAKIAGETPLYEEVTPFPPVRQDIAIILDDAVTADEVLSVVKAAGKQLLYSAEIFDVYRGDQVGMGRYSLAVRLEFSSPERTLTDEEVDKQKAKIVAAVQKQLQGELRG